MHPFSTSWNHQKTLRFSNVLRGYRKGALETNGLLTPLKILRGNMDCKISEKKKLLLQGIKIGTS